MLACHVEWHMRRKLAPLLFNDEDAHYADTLRESAVAPASRSPSAKQKDSTERTAAACAYPNVHSAWLTGEDNLFCAKPVEIHRHSGRSWLIRS